MDRSYIDPFQEHIEKLIAVDKKDDLLDFIRSQVDKLIEDFDRNGSWLAYSILYKCVHSSALNCAAALLEEETDLTQYFKLPGLNLLHTAADVLSLKMTRYFLKFGMRADEKAAGIHTHGRQMLLPIDFAVQSVRSISNHFLDTFTALAVLLFFLVIHFFWLLQEEGFLDPRTVTLQVDF